jgi:hypothetical protein
MRRTGFGIFVLALALGALWAFRDARSLVAEIGLCPVVIVTPPGGIDPERGVELVFDPAALAALEREPASRPQRRGPEVAPERPGEAEAPAPRDNDPAETDRPEAPPLDAMAPPSALSVGDRRWSVLRALAPRNDHPERPAPTAIARRSPDRDASRIVAELLNARDEELGLRLPAAGNIASALAASVRAHTPAFSRAIFVATVDEQGRIARIAVASFSTGEAEGWHAAAREAEAALAGATFALRGDLPHGAIVTVQLVQNLELPSGRGREHRLSAAPRLPGAVPSPYEGRRLTRNPDAGPAAMPVEIERLGSPEAMLPPCPGDGGATVQSELPCACVGGFDLSDIGAHEQRIVKVATSVAPRAAPRPPTLPMRDLPPSPDR